MTFDEMLLNYERELSSLESAFENQQRTIAEKKAQYNQRIKAISQQIVGLLSQINELETTKYVSVAAERLQGYFDWFKIDSENIQYGSDAQLSRLYDSIRNLKEERSSIEKLLKELASQLENRQEEFNRAKSELTRPVQEQYQIITGGSVINYDIAGKTFAGSVSLPSEVVIGNVIKPVNRILSNISGGENLHFPLSINLRNGGNIILHTSKSIADEEVARIFVALALKMLEAFPYGTLKVGIVNYTSFSCVDALHRAIAKSEASLGDLVVDIRGIDQLIPDVTRRCADINGKLLTNNCSNLFELYEKGIETEQFQLILIKDALKDINETNLRMLYSWVATYAKCGVRFVLIDEMSEETFKSKSATYRELIEQIKATCQVFTFSDRGILSGQGEAIELIGLNKNNTDGDVYTYCSQYVELSSSKKGSYISYEQIGFGRDNNKSDTSISIPIAYNAPNVWNIEFHCSSRAPLANLIVGIPGTGKSRLIDAMILNGAIKYSPDELTFHLLDFKQALSSDAYLTDCRIPHVKVVSRENKAEDADIILSSILSEIEDRGSLFKQSRVDSIAGYNKLSTKKLPRIVIVIDECQHLFEDDNLSKKCEQIVREGRAFGIHLVLATQTVNQQMMKTIKFVDGRYCFEVAAADADLLLDREHAKRIDEVNKASHKAFVTDFSSGEKEIIKIEPAFDGDLDDSRSKRSAYAEMIRCKWRDYPIDVFDAGNQEALLFSQITDLTPYTRTDDDFIIGHNFQNASDICVRFRREKQSALFMVSGNALLTDNVLCSIVVQGCLKGVLMYIVNAMGNRTFGRVSENLIPREGANLYQEAGYLEALSEVYRIYQVRMATPNADYDPVVFVVNGLQNLLDFTNNTKKEFASNQSTVVPEEQVDEREMDFFSTLQHQRDRQNSQACNSITITGKGSLLELISNAYRVNIFLACAIDSVNISNATGNVLSSQDKNIIRACNYKIIDSDVGDDIQSVMESSFRLRMLQNMNENICFISERQRNYYKAKFIQYDLDSPSVVAKLRTLIERSQN